MKLKTSKGIYGIVNAEHKEGKLNIDFSDKTCEELQEIFSDKESIVRLEIYEDENLMSVIPGYVVLEQVTLQGETKTVVLGKEVDDTEKRITALSERTEAVMQTGEENTESIEKLQADIDYISMNMEVTMDE